MTRPVAPPVQVAPHLGVARKRATHAAVCVLCASYAASALARRRLLSVTEAVRAAKRSVAQGERPPSSGRVFASVQSFHPNSPEPRPANGHSLRLDATNAGDSKSPALTGLRVRVPPPAPTSEASGSPSVRCLQRCWPTPIGKSSPLAGGRGGPEEPTGVRGGASRSDGSKPGVSWLSLHGDEAGAGIGSCSSRCRDWELSSGRTTLGHEPAEMNGNEPAHPFALQNGTQPKTT